MQRILLLALMLFSFVAIFTSVPHNAFASPSYSRQEQWNGAGTLSTGGSFPMILTITVRNGGKFDGTIDEGPHGSAQITGSFTSESPYGGFYFNTIQYLSGDMCPNNCNFGAEFELPDQSRMQGSWYAVAGETIIVTGLLNSPTLIHKSL